jgi:hypothetical protein
MSENEHEASPRVNLPDLLAYLGAAGWAPESVDDPRSSVWHLDTPDRGDLVIALPRNEAARDVDEQVREALATLAFAEHRSPREVTTDLQAGGADSVSVRLLPDSTPGRAPLALAQAAISALRLFVVGAAAGLTTESLVLGSRRPARAETFAATAQLATIPGSFILDLALPLGDAESTPQDTLIDLRPQPFGRRVAARMKQTAERALLKAQQITEGQAAFADFAVPNLGLGNATELDALARLGGDQLSYQLRFTQSALAPGRDAARLYTATRTQQEVLAEASEYLRQNLPREGVTVEGLVVRLFREGALGPGEVTLQAILDDSGREKRCRVSLAESDYDEALRAHTEGRRVRATGDIAMSGTRLRLERLTSFEVMPSLDEA